MNPYPQELRQRIVSAVGAGEPIEEIVEQFTVSRATIYRYLARQRTEGHLVPTPKPGRPRLITLEAESNLRLQIAGAQDATLAHHCTAWVERGGAAMHPATMHRAIVRLGVTRKKRSSMRANVMRKHEQPGGMR